MEWLNVGLPVFGTGTALAEQVFALGIASQPAETGATIGPTQNKTTICHVAFKPTMSQ